MVDSNDSNSINSKYKPNINVMSTYSMTSKIDKINALISIIVKKSGTGASGAAPKGSYSAMVKSLVISRTGFKSKTPGARVLRIEMRLVNSGECVWMNLLFPEADQLLTKLSGLRDAPDEEKIQAAMKRHSLWLIYYRPDEYKSIKVLEEIV